MRITLVLVLVLVYSNQDCLSGTSELGYQYLQHIEADVLQPLAKQYEEFRLRLRRIQHDHDAMIRSLLVLQNEYKLISQVRTRRDSINNGNGSSQLFESALSIIARYEEPPLARHLERHQVM